MECKHCVCLRTETGSRDGVCGVADGDIANCLGGHVFAFWERRCVGQTLGRTPTGSSAPKAPRRTCWISLP